MRTERGWPDKQGGQRCASPSLLRHFLCSGPNRTSGRLRRPDASPPSRHPHSQSEPILPTQPLRDSDELLRVDEFDESDLAIVQAAWGEIKLIGMSLTGRLIGGRGGGRKRGRGGVERGKEGSGSEMVPFEVVETLKRDKKA